MRRELTLKVLRINLKLLSSIIDIFYHPKCVACGRSAGSEYICKNCIDGIHMLCVDSYAPIRCEYSQLWALAAYEGPWMEVIHKFKYGRQRTAIRVIRKMLEKQVGFFYYVDCIVPVPLHRWRYITRGYNQSAIVAKMISKIIDRPVFHRALVKRVNTPPQVGMTLRERTANLKGVFSGPVFMAQSVEGKNVLLVDDVVTSGSTASECAKILVKSGAKRVDVLTLAKTL